MRITAIAGTTATIASDGLEQQASIALVPQAAVGDYVLVHAGYAISVLDEQEAAETLALFAELDAFAAEDEGRAADPGRGEDDDARRG
jgi:hydrogenase expression/formation protein HypC